MLRETRAGAWIDYRNQPWGVPGLMNFTDAERAPPWIAFHSLTEGSSGSDSRRGIVALRVNPSPPAILNFTRGSVQRGYNQRATPPWCEQVPVRCRLKL